MSEFVVLRLEGAMQSWGRQAYWDHRGTATMPTKSAICGLVGAAMGIPRDDNSIAELCRTLEMGTREERAGRVWEDYQTVTGEPLMNAENKPRQNGNTIVSTRQYLADAVFLVALGGESELLHRIAAALENPRYPIYLGRRCCVPSRPPFLELTNAYETMDELLRHYPAEDKDASLESMRRETETDFADDCAIVRSDLLVNAPMHGFGMRAVRWTVGEHDVSNEA